MSDGGIDPAALAQALRELAEFASRQAPARESPVRAMLIEHFGADPESWPVVTEEFSTVDRPNVFRAFDAWADRAGRSARVQGLSAPGHGPIEVSFFLLLSARMNMQVALAAGSLLEVPVGPGVTMRVPNNALVLVRDGEQPLAVLVAAGQDRGVESTRLLVQVVCEDSSRSSAFLAELRSLMVERNVYRGQVLSLVSRMRQGPVGGGSEVAFLDRVGIDRDSVVLPQGVLDRVERQVVRTAELAPRLRAAGRDVKRGVLLFGPPGTGKTFTIKYLCGLMPERTVVIVAGADPGALLAACRIATSLAPSMVVLEDVDLIAAERSFQHGQNPMLAALMNEIDAVDGSADVAFVLTSNRADILEPALAARPGRVDQAIEIPLPDAECRARLLRLYASEVEFDADETEALVARLEGVSAAFVKELARRADLRAGVEDRDLVAADITDALDELFAEGDVLTRTLLGAPASHAGGGGQPPFAPEHRPHLAIPMEVMQRMRGPNG